jgi:secreted Zn-dependent insulinase-like peptidase
LASSSETEIVAAESDFTKPDRDRSEYRWIRMKNNLQVLLVSTSASSNNSDGKSSSAKVEAASVHVQAGHFDDTIPGLYVKFNSKLVCDSSSFKFGFVSFL